MCQIHLRAKQSLHWLGINQDIRNKVENCILCQAVVMSQQKVPAIPCRSPIHILAKDRDGPISM